MKASDNIFPKVILDAQTSAPAAPTDDSWKVYSMADGVYARSSNTIVGPFSGGGGVTSVSHTSNTYTGAITLAAGANVAITSPSSGTFTVHSSATGGAGGGAPTTATYVTTTADGTLSAEKVRADLKSYHPDNYPASSNAVSNEFDGTSGGSYTWTTSPGSSDENSTYPGHLYIPSTVNTGGYYYYRAAYAPGATDFTVVAKFEPGFDADESVTWQLGISLLDSSDVAIWRVLLLDDAGNDGLGAYRYNDTNAGTLTLAFGWGTPIYLMIQRTSGNAYTGYWSANGKTWIRGGGSTVATAVAKVGIALNSSSTASSKKAVIDFIRVFDSITEKIGA